MPALACSEDTTSGAKPLSAMASDLEGSAIQMHEFCAESSLRRHRVLSSVLRQVTHDRAPVLIIMDREGWPDLQSPTLAVLLEIITDARNPKYICCDNRKGFQNGVPQNLANKTLANIKGAWPDLDHKLQAIHFSRNETTVERRASAQHCQVPLEQNAKKKIALLRFLCSIATEQTPH